MKKIILLLAISISFIQCVTDDYVGVDPSANASDNDGLGNTTDGNNTSGTGTTTGGTQTSNKTNYLEHVQPILNQLCVTCHNSTTHKDGVDISTYSKAKNSIDKIISSMNKQDDEVMPPSGRVADNLIQIMKDWKNDGLPEGTATTGGGTTASVTYIGNIQVILAQQCNACHGATNPSANLNLTTYTNAKNNIGKIINRIDLQTGQSGIMPTSGRMSEANIQAFKDWQTQGFLQQ